MRYAVLVNSDKVAVELSFDAVKEMVVVACKSGATPEEALELVREELKRRFIRT